MLPGGGGDGRPLDSRLPSKKMGGKGGFWSGADGVGEVGSGGMAMEGGSVG